MHKIVAIAIAVVLLCCGGPVTAAQGTRLVLGPASPSTREMSGPAKDADSPNPNQDLSHRDTRYRLCTSDVVALTFPLTPEFNQTVSIQPDGFATLAGAGSVRLEGLTTEQSEAAVQLAYAGILHNPIVTIDLRDFNKPYFIVGGEVGHPGKFDLRGETSATEAIAIAGGFNDSSRHSQVLLFRRVNSGWFEVKPLNLKRILQGHDVAEDPEIQPGDMLFVPQNTLSKVKKFIPSSGLGAYYQP